MPSTRAKRTRKSQGIEDWKIEFLLYGCCKRDDGSNRVTPYLWREEYGGPFCNVVLKAWRELRDELLPQWIKDHPGSRPWAWWKIDAPGPRGESETETDYLRRHGLLTAAELKLSK